MSPLLAPLLADLFGRIADNVWPDPEKKAAAQLELLRMQQTGELKELDAAIQLSLAQANINNSEAADPSLFKSGWRPYIGWVCGFGLTYQFLIRPIFSPLLGVAFPPLDMETLVALLFGILGLGGYRTIEKIKRVS